MIELTSYDSKYDEEIAALDGLMSLEIRYHADVLSESVCIALSDGKVAGVSYIIRHSTFLHIRKKLEAHYLHGVYKALPGHECEVEISDALVEDLKETYRRVASAHPGKPVRLRMWCGAEKTGYAQFLMSHGFKMSRIMPVMVRDLRAFSEEKKTDPSCISKLPAGYELREATLDDAFSAQYLKVNGACFIVPDSLNELRFYTAGGARIFAVLKDGALCAALTTWRISDTRAATENIFCKPSFRRKGLTSALIDHVSGILSDEGYSEASLSLFGENRPAFHLYEKLGYETQGFVLEAVYDTESDFRPY